MVFHIHNEYMAQQATLSDSIEWASCSVRDGLSIPFVSS
jgi:hypothetical protein